MEGKDLRPSFLAASAEYRRLESCVRNARVIIAELELSNADHGDDVAILHGLIETWTELGHVQEEEMRNVQAEARRRSGR